MRRKKFPSPYQDGLQKYIAEKRTAFHMPGHKGKFLTHGVVKNILPPELFACDITASYERGDLYNPKHFLQESINNLAKIYGSAQSFYLVNGSTGGNQAALIATLKPNDKILLPRTVHKLIYGVLVATKAKPVYLESVSYKNNPLIAAIDPALLKKTLKKHPDIRVIYLVNPNYIGICSDLREIIRIAHAHGKIVIVDEAHGAHFDFHPGFPRSAVKLKADIVIQSAHKSLNALSQTALLHVCGKRVDRSRVEQVIGMYQTSSPNTILLLSLEASVVQMANHGRKLLEKTLKLATTARKEINQTGIFHCHGDELLSFPHIYSLDRTKLYVDVSATGITGHEIKHILGKQYGVEAELSDHSSILFSVTLGDTAADIQKLIHAFKAIAKNLTIKKEPHNKTPLKIPSLPAFAEMTPAEAFYAKHEDILLSKSVGRISAEMITPYPPGVPILMPGDKISKRLVDYLKILIQEKAAFSGTKYRDFSKIAVVKKNQQKAK